MFKQYLSALLFASATVHADIYFHNPRGSNNRLDEQGRERANANRMFDSQNNNRGGMNVGSVYYYEGSYLNLEWSPQHSCGGPNNHCEIILQYMCDKNLRDGTTTKTIPENPANCYNNDCDTDVRYGHHEDYDYYMFCKYRERNKGLFTSSQKLEGLDATKTRQNPNGARRGYECPEERDYYPYWSPSPWRDIAILTNEEKRCAAYRAESENVKGRSYCRVDVDAWKAKYKNKNQFIPLDPDECNAINFTSPIDNSEVLGKWTRAPSHGLPAPDCLLNQQTRDNHHGNAMGSREWPTYRWRVPIGQADERCAMRVRYNISTGDMDHFDSSKAVTSALLTSKNNTKGKNNQNPAEVILSYASSSSSPSSSTPLFNNLTSQIGRGYKVANNPQVDLFGFGPNDAGNTLLLQLAVNTAQYGRTFQDRSHRFAIRSRPESLANTIIHNVQVRGKRGNIVQTYPATEYDFVPTELSVGNGEFVHFQWTGSNTNPDNNAGQGRAGSDRSNIVLMKSKNYDEPSVTNALTDNTNPKTKGHYGNSYPNNITGQGVDAGDFLGLSFADQLNLAILSNMQMGGEMSELDDAGTYFDLGPRNCTKDGTYNYVCTRNNNFSNRSQKGKIKVNGFPTITRKLGLTGGEMVGPAQYDKFVVGPNALTATQEFSLIVYPSQKITWDDQKVQAPGSKVLHVAPSSISLASGATAKVCMVYVREPVTVPVVYESSSVSGPWTQIEEESLEWIEGKDGETVVCAETTKGGYFVVENAVDGWLVFLIVLLVILAIAGMVFGVRYFMQKRGLKMKGFRLSTV